MQMIFGLLVAIALLIFLILKTNDISLKEMFAKYNGENLTKEFTWDEPKGKEIW